MGDHDHDRDSIKSRIARSAEHLRDEARQKDDGDLQWFHAGVFEEAAGLIRDLEAELAHCRTMLSAARQDRDHYEHQCRAGNVFVENTRKERDDAIGRLEAYRKWMRLRPADPCHEV
jgi:hypothetical protein